MNLLAQGVLKFFKGFLLKYLSTVVLEKLVIEVLGILVHKTESDLDDKIYNIVFSRIKEKEKA